ncbi:hypothetical protein ACUYGN_15125 [Enterobacter chengduensis]
MSNIDKQALNQEKIEWLNKLADMEYCKSNPGHWLMSLKDTNMLAKLALRSVALLDELEAKDKSISFLKDQLAQLANFNPDWDKLEAATDSLREHMAELTAARKRIAELEAKLDSADKLQDSAFRHGLQHGFSLGQTDNQAGFEECLSAYGTGKGE